MDSDALAHALSTGLLSTDVIGGGDSIIDALLLSDNNVGEYLALNTNNLGDYLKIAGVPSFGGSQPPAFAGLVATISFNNENAAWQWSSPNTIGASGGSGFPSFLFLNNWDSQDAQYLGQTSGDRLDIRPAPDSGAFGSFPLTVSLGDDSNRNVIYATWGGLGIKNVSLQDDLAIFENGSAPPSGEEGFAIAVHHKELNVWSDILFKTPHAHDASYLAFGYKYDLTDFGIPVGGHVDAIRIQNIVRGDRTADDSYGFLTVFGDGTGSIFLEGLTAAPFAASKLDPDPTYAVALSPLE
jgi:hypothetical protein